MTTTRRLLTVLALVLAAAMALAACGGDDSGSAGASDTEGDASETSTSEVPASVPPDTTLRVGDQLETLQTVLGTAGEDAEFPYDLQYASFVGGPPMLQAFQAGEIDLGWVADTPLIFAQAAGQDIVAVAGWAPERPNFRLIVPPGSAIDGWDDLEGNKIAYQQGTVLEAVVLKGLDQEGLAFDDITTVNVPVTEITATLLSGDVDAGILVPPLDAAYFEQEPDATFVEAPEDITLRINFLITRRETLEDPAKTAAIRDYALRLVRAYSWLNDNTEAFVQSFFVERYGLTPQEGAEVADRAGPVSFLPLPGDIIPEQQRLADLYVEAGEIPETLDVIEQFDGRLNDVLLGEQEAARAGG